LAVKVRRSRCTHGLVFALALVASASSLGAQRVTSSVDLAGASLWYADSIRATGSTISPAFSFDWPRATIAAAGTLSRLDNGGTSAQGTFAPSLFTPSAGAASLELSGSFGGSAHHDGTRTGQMLATARGHLMGSTRGGWVGAGAGRTWDGAIWRGVQLAEAGAWIHRETIIALGTVSPIVVDDSIRYTDLQASVRRRMRKLELGFTAGARAGQVASLAGTERAWGSASITGWVHPNLAVVASAGSYPVDFTQGYPGGRFATIALRLAARPRSTGADQTGSRPRASSVLTAEIEQAKASGVTEMTVQASAGNRQTIRVRASSAQRVELSGDFTTWRPTALSREAGGWWTTTLAVEPGTYQMSVRVDGGPWVVPPGLTTVVDEFGGVAGVVTFERR
jgi:hypothetical protein